MAISSYVGAEIIPANNTFETWLSRTNDIISDMGSTVITVGDNNTGNVFIDGVFGANTLYAGTELRGGDANNISDFVISSNVEFTGANTTITSGEIQLTGNVDINSATSDFNVSTIQTTITSTNTIITGLAQLSDVEISGDLSVSGNATFTSDVSFSANVQSFSVPTGNTTSRPDPAEAGMFRFNTELEVFEGYDGVEWSLVGGDVLDRIVDISDTSDDATYYITFVDTANGSVTEVNVSDNNLTFNPSTGTVFTTNLDVETATINSINVTEDIQGANASFDFIDVTNDLTVDLITANNIVANTVTAATFDTTSDRRLKENIADVSGGIEKVSQLQGVYYNLNGVEDRNLGLIAQDVESVLPEVVKTNEYGYKSISYGNIVAVLIEAIKDLQQQIDELKKS